jgi:hypothetical protein
MIPMLRSVVGSASLLWCGCHGPKPLDTGTPIPLKVAELDLVNVRADAVSYEGRAAIRLVEDRAAPQQPDTSFLAIVRGTDFSEGTIEVSVAGAPPLDASAGARGFVGIAFHVQGERGERHQAFYLRPTNGRADDQLRRNHAVQYQASPEFPWHRLRSEQPGLYESYVDLEPGRWTDVRIEVTKNGARLFVHGSPQASLIVNDLKASDRDGRIALWIGPEAIGHFSGLRVSAHRSP